MTNSNSGDVRLSGGISAGKDEGRKSPTIRQARHQPTRTVGFWLAALMAVLQSVNAIRSFADPGGFADYMGVPLVSAEQVDWVQIYGLRAAFIALLTIVLLARKELAALQWIALAALVMPIGDAWITFHAGAPWSTVARHAAIAVFLIVAWYFLARAARQQAGESKG